MGQLSCLFFPCLSTWQHLLSDTFICPHRILTFDVGSQQPEWKKCIHCFDSITSIISLHCTEKIWPGAFGGVKNCEFTPLSLCATSADSSFCTTKLDDKVACPVWEHHQQAAVPTHVDHPLPQHHQGIQEHTPQAVLSCAFATIYVIWLCVFASLQVLLEKYFPQYSLGPILTKREIHIMALHASKLGIIERSESPSSSSQLNANYHLQFLQSHANNRYNWYLTGICCCQRDDIPECTQEFWYIVSVAGVESSGLCCPNCLGEALSDCLTVLLCRSSHTRRWPNCFFLLK